MSLEKILDKPMGAYTALITEATLFYVAYLFFSADKTVEMIGVFLIIELRHFRYIWHRKNKT